MQKGWLMVVLTLLLAGWLYAADTTITVEGKLVSASCYLADNSATGNDMNGFKGCGTECLRRGKPGGLLTKDHHFYMLDASSLALAPYVGQDIRVTGIEHKDVISARSVAVKKGSGWEGIDTRHPETLSK